MNKINRWFFELFKKLGFLINSSNIVDMGIEFGNWDPLKLTLNILNQLMANRMITFEQAREIIIKSLSERMSEQEKQDFVNRILIRNPNPPTNG